MAPPVESLERRKVAIACENCRARKVRCDGCRPGKQPNILTWPQVLTVNLAVCRACTRRNDSCKYTVSLAPWDRRRQKYVQDLERKIQVLEGSPQASPTTTPTGHTGGDAITRVQQSDSGGSSSMFNRDWQGNTESQVAPDCPPQLTGDVHLGQSSTSVFIRELQNSITQPIPRPTTGIRLDDLAVHTPIGNRVSSDYVLPPRGDAERLLHIYRNVHYTVYPALYWDEFLGDFNALYDGSAQQSNKCRMTHCLANLIFALAERSTVQSSAGPDYFERAKRLLQFDIFGDISFQVIQALVLCAQYLQSAERPRQCWVILGLAIRAAQSIGLHMPEAVKNIQPPRDQCLASVVWSCLVTIDRTLSMTLGRPPTLSLSAARAMRIPDFAPIAEENSLPIPNFFIQSYRLFDVLHEILVSLYSENTKVILGVEILGHTSRLERELDRWTDGLPGELKLRTDSVALSQAHFLRQRCLQVLMILFRPGLSATIRSSSTTERDLEEATAWYCATRCIEAASEMVDIASLQSEADGQGTSVAPWWYNVQFCYNAGTSLLAARLSIKTAEKLGVSRLDESLGKCIRTLKSYGSICPSTSRCLSAFASVAEKAGYLLPSMSDDEPEAQFDIDPIDLRHFDGFPMEDYWSFNWTSTPSTMLDPFSLPGG